MPVHGSVGALGEGHLAEEAAVLAEVEAVVGGEYDGSILGEAHVLDHAEQVADPRIDHGDLARISGARLGDLLLGIAGGFLPETVGRLYDLAVVVWHVEATVVRGGIPRLMGIPRVDVEEEVLSVVKLEPPHGPRDGLGDVAVGLEAPCLAGVAGLVMVMSKEAGDRAFLSGVHGEGLEALIVVHAAAQVEGSVDHSGGVVAVGGEDLGEGRCVVGQGFPAHEGHGPATEGVVGAGGHGREPGGVVSRKEGGLGCEGVERGGQDGFLAVCAKVVLSKGIGNYPNDVHARGPVVVSLGRYLIISVGGGRS